MTGFIVSVFLFRNRVSPNEAFEGLELGEGKPSRPVLRGPGGCKAARLLGSNPGRRDRPLRRLHCVSAESEGTREVHGKMDLSKHMLFQSVRLVGAVGIEPTTSSMPWKRAPSCATGQRLKTKSPRPPNRDRGKYRIHFRRWHSTPTRHFTFQVPRLGFQQSS